MVDWINYRYYNQQRIVNFTTGAVKGLSEQLDEPWTCYWQSEEGCVDDRDGMYFYPQQQSSGWVGGQDAGRVTVPQIRDGRELGNNDAFTGRWGTCLR